MPLRNIPIARPSMGEEEWQAIREPIINGWLTAGPKVKEFENKFANHHNVNHAIATTSCTTGLHLILAAMGVGPGDEVIVPSFTWIATANVVLYCGATPVLADVLPSSYNIDPDDISRKLSSKTKAIIAVHLFGMPADIEAIKRVAPGIPIVEDAACAAGASVNGCPVGGLGVAAAFSFHPRKSITTGEGGMVTTNDSSLAERMEQLRNHGASISEEQRHKGPKPYLLPEFNLLGFNYRMTDLQAAVGIVQLGKLERFIAERNEQAQKYSAALKELPGVTVPVIPAGYRHAWQAYVCRIDPKVCRNDLMESLQARGIGTRPGTHAVHTLAFYKNLFGYNDSSYPQSHAAQEESIALPLHNCLSESDLEFVISSLQDLLG